MVQVPQVRDRPLVALQKRYELGGERSVEIDREIREPDANLPDIDVERDHPAVFGPQPVENALDDGGLAAFPAGEKRPGFGPAPGDEADPFVQTREFLFPSHEKIGIADGFGQRIPHDVESFLQRVRSVLFHTCGAKHITVRDCDQMPPGLFGNSDFGRPRRLQAKERKLSNPNDF